MRVVLIGEVQFSYAMFREILASSLEVVGVCTRRGSARGSDKIDLGSYADAAGVAWKAVDSINDLEAMEWLKSLDPDVLLCLGWSEIIRREVLSICPGRVIGYHPTALPRHRGRHPLIWTLALGLRQTASTFFIMNEGADAGDIISQEPISVDDDDYAIDLYRKVIDVACKQMRCICDQLVSNRLVGTAQDSSQASYWRRRNDRDGVIDWRMSSSTIRNLVRALSDPYPGAMFRVQDEMFACRRARVIPWGSVDVEPGKVLAISETALVVKTSNGAVELSDLSGMPPVGEGDYL